MYTVLTVDKVETWDVKFMILSTRDWRAPTMSCFQIRIQYTKYKNSITPSVIICLSWLNSGEKKGRKSRDMLPWSRHIISLHPFIPLPTRLRYSNCQSSLSEEDFTLMKFFSLLANLSSRCYIWKNLGGTAKKRQKTYRYTFCWGVSF